MSECISRYNIARDANLCDFLIDYWMFDSSLIFGLQSVGERGSEDTTRQHVPVCQAVLTLVFA